MAYVRATEARSCNEVTGETEYVYDEFTQVFKVRYLTATEAFLRLWGYPVVKLSHTVHVLYVHLPGYTPVYFKEGEEDEGEERAADPKDTELMAYFKLNNSDREAVDLRFDTVVFRYYFDKRKCAWIKRKRTMEKILTRVARVNPKDVEKYALRLLLMHTPSPTCFDDLKINPISGEQFSTFEAAAKHRGLIENNDLWIKTCKEASDEIKNSFSFRRWFAVLLFHVTPSDPQQVFEQCLDLLVTPLPNGDNESRRRETALQHIEYVLRQFNSSCETIGLQQPMAYNHEMVDEEVNREWHPDHIGNLLDGGDGTRFSWQAVAEDHIGKLNEQQHAGFIKIITAVRAHPKQKICRCFHVSGDGGSGKTFLFETLIAQLYSDKKFVKVCASTGIAATLLINGATAHSTFGIPNDVTDSTPSTVEFEKAFAANLRKIDVIIIDEISALHKNAFAFIDRQMKAAMAFPLKTYPFGGKVVVTGGDWKQLMPVEKRAGPLDQLNASVKFSEIFRDFETIRLTTNMRVAVGEQEFVSFLRNVGNGLNYIDDTEFVEMPDENITALPIDNLISFCSDERWLANSLSHGFDLCSSAILSPTNATVDYINNEILKKMPTDEFIYVGSDFVIGEGPLDRLSVHISDTCIEQIHEMNPPRMPPYKLHLKVGCIVICLKNIDISNGLCNGTRLQVVEMKTDILKCRRIALGRSGRGQQGDMSTVILPRMTFEFGNGPSDLCVHFKRIQFPVKLAFGMTINKAQGQTLNKVGIALHQGSVFSHGQLYTALSRVRKFSSLKLTTGKRSRYAKWVRNIVQKEILSGE